MPSGEGALDQRQPRGNDGLAHGPRTRRTFVERVIAVNRSRRVGASPRSAAATAAGTSSIGNAPVEGHPLGDAELGGQRPQLVLGVTAAIQVEADIEVGPLDRNAGHRTGP